MTDDENEGETTATTSDVGDSSAKRRLRNRRLNLNKLSREDHVFNGVCDSQYVQVSHSAMFSKFFIFSNTPLVLNRQKIMSYLQG